MLPTEGCVGLRRIAAVSFCPARAKVFVADHSERLL